MENLINFDDESEKTNVNTVRPKSPMPFPLLVADNEDLNNPFDKLDYRATYSNDPFECLENFNDFKKPDSAEEKLQDGSL